MQHQQRQRRKFESDENLAEAVVGHGPCTYLLLSLLALILVYPYCKGGGVAGRVILAALYSCVLIGGTYATGRSRKSLLTGIILAAVGISLQWSALIAGKVLYFQLAAVTFLVSLTLAVAMVLRYLLMKGPVTADKLHGALAGYIRIAFFWAIVYALLESLDPESFNLGQKQQAGNAVLFPLLYFSFTTLTTVGYGDITPATDQARSLVMVEQVTGIFFVAVLIARLAGLYPPQPAPDPPPAERG